MSKKAALTLKNLPAFMKGWQLDSYAGIGALALSNNVKVPVLSAPQDVLIKVQGSSVNPLDVMMTRGYGKTVLDQLRSDTKEKRILGRDFSGTIVDVGMNVTDYKIGDQVWGATFPSSQGSHADYVVADSTLSIAHKPVNLSHVQAASMPYIALTAWSAIMISAGLSSRKSNVNANSKVLVIGAAGGVGSFAVQLLKSLNYSVVAVSSDFEMVADLGVDVVLDHHQPDYVSMLEKVGKFDVIFDFAGLGEKSLEYMKYLKPWANSRMVTLTSPLLKSTDSEGLALGAIKTVFEVASKNIQTILSNNGSTLRYGYFMPNPSALKTVSKLVENGKIKPLIHNEFSFQDLPEAYQKVENGHLRGKIVVKHHE